MARLGRVLTIVDGDNLCDYFYCIGSYPDSVIKFYQKNRPSVVKPVFYMTQDAGSSHYNLDTRSSFLDNLRKHQELDLREIPKKKYYQTNFDNHGDFSFRSRGYADLDLFIVALENMKNFHTLMLFAQDAHYINAVKYLRKRRKRVELYHSGSFISSDLCRACNLAVNMASDFRPNWPDSIKEMIEIAKEKRRSYPSE